MGVLRPIVATLIAVFMVMQMAVSRFVFSGSMKMCDTKAYNASLQCCCDFVLQDIPEEDCQCCKTVGYRWTDVKPEDCTRPCGSQRYHPDSQLCCEGRVFNSSRREDVCCGPRLIDSRSQVCCPLQNSSLPLERRYYRCCQGIKPYHRSTMRCDAHTGVPLIRGRQHFHPQTLCTRQLPVFHLSWPSPKPYYDDSQVHIRAIPESCKVSVKNESSGGIRITIPLTSFAIVRRHPDSQPHCLSTAKIMELVVKVSSSECCASERELRQYLQGQVLDLWVKKSVVCSKRPVRPVLRLKDGHNAVLYLAGASSTLVEQSLPRP